MTFELSAENISGTLTLIFAFAMTFIAIPKMILKQRRAQKCLLDATMSHLPCLVYGTRAWHGYEIASWFVFTSDGLALVISLALVYQYWAYENE